MHRISERQLGWSAAAWLVAWIALGVLPAAAAGVYKWTDDQGVIHYSDQMPADAANKGSVVLDKQGRQVKKIDAALTPAQVKAKAAEDEHQRLMAKTQEDKTRRDTALTHSYTSEEEIDFARNRSLQAIESQIKAAETYIADLTRRRQELQKDKLAYGAKPVPAKLDIELGSLDEELVRQDKVLAQRRTEVTAINAKYESDKQRWRELRSDQKPPVNASAATPQVLPSKSATSSVTSSVAK